MSTVASTIRKPKETRLGTIVASASDVFGDESLVVGANISVYSTEHRTTIQRCE